MGNSGPLACDRCGGGIEQPATGRRRRYCSRTCRELAYRVRSRDRAIEDALKAAGVGPALDSSTVDINPVPVTSVVETRGRVINAPLGMLWGLSMPHED